MWRIVGRSYQLPVASYQIVDAAGKLRNPSPSPSLCTGRGRKSPNSVNSIRMLVFMIVMFVMAGCGGRQSQAIQRIALLAAFEGRYSEVGYDAYYAARLALADAGNISIELLAIDDGGSAASAAERVQALRKDPLIKAVIAVGYDAADKEAQRALEGLPMIVVGHWQTRPESPSVFMLASQQLDTIVTISPSRIDIADMTQINLPMVGGEVFALHQFPFLNPDYRQMTIASSASLPDETFRERFMNSGLYVPEPGLLATLTYDAVGMVLAAMKEGDVATALASQSYEGLNGTIRFENGYWVDAPIHYYRYANDGELAAVDGPIE